MKPQTIAEARKRFYTKFGAEAWGGLKDWAAVQQRLGEQRSEPTTVEEWMQVGQAIIDASMPVAPASPPVTPIAPTASAAAPLRYSFEVRAKIGDVEGPLTVSGERLSDVLIAVQRLPRTPGLTLIEEAREWQTLPDGRPICPKHRVPMSKREKQGDTWYSHSVEDADGNVCYCKGYGGKDSPGWYVE